MNRRGFILPLAMLTMALMGALAGAVMLFARLRWQSGERSLEALQARIAAESEVDRVRALWDPLRADSLAIGGVVAVSAGASGRGLAVADTLLRLGQGLFLVRAVAVRSAADGTILARYGAAGLIRLVAPTLPDSMGVAAVGPVEVVGTGQVSGDDHVPAGWTMVCSAPAPPATAVMAAVGLPVRGLCSSGPCIQGAPAVGLDSALSRGTLFQLGPVTLADLITGADHRVSGTLTSLRPSITGGICVQGDSLNWGDPASVTSPCGSFFPVIVAAPSTRVLSGQGQGVLVATGGLELGGDAAFSGVVIASGAIIMRDQARISGLVVALDSLMVGDAALIERSRCATRRSLRGAARPGKRFDRGWFRWD